MSDTIVGGHRELSGLTGDLPPLVGRATELAQLTELLAGARMVTVAGTGGVGKTTLAFHAAASVASRFADGVCVLPLSTLSDGKLLPHMAAARLGLSGQDTRATMDVVLDYLRDREMLLVLDTCEHLIDACADLAEALLEETPRVTVLATSRQPLAVDGEHLYPLSPLSVPAADGASSPGDAADLFTRRAAAVTGTFDVAADNRRDVATICERLDGIPLAVELAAVRLRTLPLAELARLLTSRLALSIGPDADADRRPAVPGGGSASGSRLSAVADEDRAEARHRTLRATIGWSYDLCTPAEQALWERLSVFAGSFSIDAAQDVCAGRGLPRESVADALLSLVEKSVLVRDAPAEDGRSRYRFLDTIREFGAERLAASGAETGVQDRFIARYRDMAKYFGDHFLDDDQVQRYHELASEHASITAAFEHALESGQVGRIRAGAEMAADLYGYWVISGRLREADYWLEKALLKLPGTTRERAWAHVILGYLSGFQGKTEKAAENLLTGIALADEIGDRLVLGRGYLYLCLGLAFGGQPEESAEAGDKAQQLMESTGDRIGLLTLDGAMAHMYQLSGNVEAASRRYQVFVRRAGQTRERWLYGYLDGIQGLSLFWQPGRETECAVFVGRCLLAKHEIGDIPGMAYALDTFSWLAARAGRYERCAWLLGAADILWERSGPRLSGTAVLEQVHQQTAQAAREALGDKRFDTLYDQGRRHPLDEVVSATVSDANNLPRDIPPGAAG